MIRRFVGALDRRALGVLWKAALLPPHSKTLRAVRAPKQPGSWAEMIHREKERQCAQYTRPKVGRQRKWGLSGSWEFD